MAAELPTQASGLVTLCGYAVQYLKLTAATPLNVLLNALIFTKKTGV
jgi:hypothetical protein